MFATQQIVSQVQRTEDVKARRRDAHAGQRVMIDGVREKHAMIVEGKLLTSKVTSTSKRVSLRLCFFS